MSPNDVCMLTGATGKKKNKIHRGRTTYHTTLSRLDTTLPPRALCSLDISLIHLEVLP
jgi:hypothetical protein